MGIKTRLFRKLPPSVKQEVRRWRYGKLIDRNQFRSEEKEFEILKDIVQPNDWVVDIGANVGHYTLLFSSLVGTGGRVIAFEPIVQTFDLLSSNVQRTALGNITLINAAVTDKAGPLGFVIPNGNLYQSHMTSEGGDFVIMGYPLRNFLPQDIRVSFLKIDAEGCDAQIVRECVDIISRDRPVVMIEVTGAELTELIEGLSNYRTMMIHGSHNGLLVPTEAMDRLAKLGLEVCGSHHEMEKNRASVKEI